MTMIRVKIRRPNALSRLDYIDVLARDLKVMDASAVTLMRDNQIPIVVFNIREQGGLARVLDGEGTCTVVGG
jgi:uridylate kinase